MKKIIVGALIFIVAAFAGGFFLGKSLQKAESPKKIASESDIKEVRQNGYQYISPLLECDTSDPNAPEFGNLEKKINDFVDQKQNDGSITDASVYYRDLDNGPWFGVNERALFAPASLLKIPVMMAYYKKAELDPALMTKKIVYKKDPGVLQQNILPDKNLEEGKPYTVEQLITNMIDYSDNYALALLEDNIDNSLIDKVTLDLGMGAADNTTPEDFMSVKSYASLFRVLYNASYLSRDNSEKALGIMVNSEFNNGIVSGVSPDIKVAHKFGERKTGTVQQLHDCGIIYYKPRPYLLCIMTRGNDIQALESFLQEVSKMVYNQVSGKEVVPATKKS